MPEAEPGAVLTVEGLTKVYSTRAPRWRRILLPWSRVDSGGRDDFDDEDDEDDDEDEEEVEYPEIRGTTTALRDVSFSLGHGEIVAVVGLPGSGRQTLHRVLGGLSPPTEGRAIVHGPMAPAPSMAKVIAPRTMSPRANVLTLARFMGAPTALAKQRLGDILEFAGLAGEPASAFRQLGSDRVRRFMLAATLHLEPAVVLAEGRLDRDPVFQARFLDRIMQLRAELGTAVLLRTEHLEFAEHVADRVLWLDRGQIQALGDPATVVAEFREALEREAAKHSTVVEGPLHRARLVDPGGAEIDTVPAGGDAHIEADVEVSALRTLIDCTLELQGDEGEPSVSERRWRVEEPGEYAVRVTVPSRWLHAGRWQATLTILTSELHGARRAAKQELAFTADGGSGDGRLALDEVAGWELRELAPAEAEA